VTAWYIHINRGVIDANTKHGRDDPPVCFRRGLRGKATYAREVALADGSVLTYSPDKPLLPCGARLVISSPTEPRIIR
jgi:hypothetical protein